MNVGHLNLELLAKAGHGSLSCSVARQRHHAHHVRGFRSVETLRRRQPLWKRHTPAASVQSCIGRTGLESADGGPFGQQHLGVGQSGNPADRLG